MQFEWFFFFLLKSHTTNKLEATVRQVLMFWKVPAKCSGKHSPCSRHALRCMHYDALLWSSSSRKGNENLCKEPHLCPEVTNIWEHKQCSFCITSKQLDTSICQEKSRYLWVTTKLSAMNFRKDYFLIKCAFLLSISSMAINTVSTCWPVSSSDINSIVDLSLETKIQVF